MEMVLLFGLSDHGAAAHRVVGNPMEPTQWNQPNGTKPMEPIPKQCVFPDIESTEEHRERWNKEWSFYFAHIAKTMGHNIFIQLPRDFFWKFHFHGGPNHGPGAVSFYEERCGVNLRNSTSDGGQPAHPAHTRLDVLLEKGILRCSDIDHMDIISVIRNPWDRFQSLCNWLELDWDRVFGRIKNGTWQMQQKTQGPGMVRFEYDWNVTMSTKENTEGITAWFANHGQEVKFDEAHHTHRQSKSRCKMSDLTEERKKIVQSAQWFMDEMALYQATRDNNGSMRIKSGYRWVRD